MNVSTGLETLIGELVQAVQENTRAVRVTNTLLLAQGMGVDASVPLKAKAVLRQLALVEKYVAGDTHD